MHACGHDAHIVVGVALAQVLHQFRAALHGKVRIFFQPAEEGTRGAHSFVAAGLLDGVEEIYGLHVGVRACETGQLVCGWDKLLGTVKLDALFKGVQSHASISPTAGRDALMAGALAVVNLKLAALQASAGTRVHAGQLVSGEARNIVASEALLKLEVRGETDELLKETRERAEALIKAAAEATQTRVRIDLVGSAPPASSDDVAVAQIRRASSSVPFFHSVTERRSDYGASDDMTVLMRRVQEQGGIAGFVGIGTPVGDGHHTPGFKIDDSILGPTAELFARVFLREALVA
jgi:aminobenzoyl-glutamate utilization protein A